MKLPGLGANIPEAVVWQNRALAAERRIKELDEILDEILDAIHELATWNEYEHNDEEPTEDDMREALTEIHRLSGARLSK